MMRLFLVLALASAQQCSNSLLQSTTQDSISKECQSVITQTGGCSAQCARMYQNLRNCYSKLTPVLQSSVDQLADVIHGKCNNVPAVQSVPEMQSAPAEGELQSNITQRALCELAKAQHPDTFATIDCSQYSETAPVTKDGLSLPVSSLSGTLPPVSTPALPPARSDFPGITRISLTPPPQPTRPPFVPLPSVGPARLPQIPSSLQRNPTVVQTPSSRGVQGFGQPVNPVYPSTVYRNPSTQFQTPSTQFQTPTTQFQTPTTQFQSSSQFQIPVGTQFQPSGAQFQIPSGTQFQIPSGTQFQAPAGPQFQQSTQFRAPGTQFQSGASFQGFPQYQQPGFSQPLLNFQQPGSAFQYPSQTLSRGSTASFSQPVYNGQPWGQSQTFQAPGFQFSQTFPQFGANSNTFGAGSSAAFGRAATTGFGGFR